MSAAFAQAAAWKADAVGCPHPDARVRLAIYLRDPKGSGPAMALCGTCKRELDGLVEREAGRAEVRATMLRLGYTRRDARTYWRDLRRHRLREWLGGLVRSFRGGCA